MSQTFIALVFLVYGLSFFSMGLIVLIEGGRGSDKRLRHALRPLAAFGLIHGIHEWQDMFHILDLLPGQEAFEIVWESIRLAALAFSFLSLTAFGASLLSSSDKTRRLSLLLPLIQASIWIFGLLIMRGQYSIEEGLLDAVDVWSRYTLGIPAAIIASAGLIAQQRAFRKVGMVRFGRDSLWAAVAFAWYGLVGQMFTQQSVLFPSTIINQNLFFELFGFPIQLMRALAAGIIAIFVIRFLRSFEVERQRQITDLQAERLEEAERREALRGELLRRVVAAQEAERQRIARELHDETGQALTAVGLGLRGISASLHQDAARASQNLHQLEKLTAAALKELQHLIADLRPSHLDDLGLPATLRWWAEEVENRVPLTVIVEIVGKEEEVAAPVRLALFRVTQEALTNVVKHAKATTATVRLIYNGEWVSVAITDDGCGFDIDRVMSDVYRRSWGLLGIQERASLLGGNVTIESQPGEGSTIKVAIPYQVQAETVKNEVSDDNSTADR
ncbi:MAG: sensor histidine kinase [Chloroflexi bacterium]|nr:sensor histidine kinase [Chloroflexota bacterium]